MLRTHVRDDENKRYMDLKYPITFCGLNVTDDETVAYAVPEENVITEQTAKKWIKAKNKKSKGLCKRCCRSIA